MRLLTTCHSGEERRSAARWSPLAVRQWPKGALLPVPLLCSVRFGTPCRRQQGEDKKAFLERLRNTLVELGTV